MTRITLVMMFCLLGCSRTLLSDPFQAGAGGNVDFAGGDSQVVTGAVIGGGGGRMPTPSAGTFGTGGGFGGSFAGASATGGFIPLGGIVAGSVGTGGLPIAGAPTPMGGTPSPGGGLPSNSGGSALGILNPQGCATMFPFVLTIDPSGDTGSVNGWLESAPSVAFEQGLPRFAVGFIDTGDISTFWSIAYRDSSGGSAMYFYGGLEPGSPIEIAVAEGAKDFSEIDRNSLKFTQGATRSMTVGEIAVIYNPDNGVSIAIRVDAFYDTDTSVDSNGFNNCTAIDASWSFTF